MQIRKKILYIWKGIYPFEIRVKKICQSLVNLGFDVYILARHGEEKEDFEIIDGIKIIRFGRNYGFMTLPVPFNLLWRSAIHTAIEQIHPDLLIIREILVAEMSAKLGHKFGVPVIMDMAENYPACMRSWKKYNSNFVTKFLVHNVKLPDLTERRSVKLCDGIMVVCNEQIERLNNVYKYNTENICVVENTPENNFISKAIYSENDVKYKLSNNLPVIFGHHGLLTQDKSIKNFLLGFEQLSYKYNLQLILSGGDECEDDYKELVKNFRSKDNIHFTGRYDYNDLPRMISEIDIGILPYPINDQNDYTIHNKVYFYMISGKPILTNLIKPYIRIFNETKAGLALDFTTPELSAVSIEQILHSNSIQMSKNGRKAVLDKYNWNIDSEKLVNFVNKYIKN